jgi:hypothetical protein
MAVASAFAAESSNLAKVGSIDRIPTNSTASLSDKTPSSISYNLTMTD